MNERSSEDHEMRCPTPFDIISTTPIHPERRAENDNRDPFHTALRNPTLPTLLHKLLRLVDLCRQIRTPASIRMIEQHELPVSLPHHLLCHSSFPARSWSVHSRPIKYHDEGTGVRCLEDERRLAPCHLGLEATFVESFAQRVGTLSVSAEGDEACATLWISVSHGYAAVIVGVRDVRRKPRSLCRGRRGGRQPW